MFNRISRRRWVALIPVVLFAIALAACGGDGDGDGDSASTPAATTAAAETATAATAEPTGTMTRVAAPTTVVGGPAAAPFGLAGLDGLSCTGEWTNETFGSTGPFAATFQTAGSGGSVQLEIGGNAFGGQGGTVDAPFTQEGETTVFDVDLAFLGRAMFRFDGASPSEATLEAPPALGDGSEVTLTDFAFDGTALTAEVDITFPDGSTAHSVLASTCS